jgi:hypothetical protein
VITDILIPSSPSAQIYQQGRAPLGWVRCLTQLPEQGTDLGASKACEVQRMPSENKPALSICPAHCSGVFKLGNSPVPLLLHSLRDKFLQCNLVAPSLWFGLVFS